MKSGSWCPAEFLWALNLPHSVFLPVNIDSTELFPIRRQVWTSSHSWSTLNISNTIFAPEMSSTWCLLVDFYSVFNSKCVQQCSLNYNLVKLKKTKVCSLLHAPFPGLCICHCKDRAACYCMLINHFLFAALYSCWVVVICEWPVSALGTAGLRNQLGVSELVCFQSWLTNNEWANAAIFSQNLLTAVDGRNSEKSLHHRKMWDRAGTRWKMC